MKINKEFGTRADGVVVGLHARACASDGHKLGSVGVGDYLHALHPLTQRHTHTRPIECGDAPVRTQKHVAGPRQSGDKPGANHLNAVARQVVVQHSRTRSFKATMREKGIRRTRTGLEVGRLIKHEYNSARADSLA